jgi:hypothetical protein
MVDPGSSILGTLVSFLCLREKTAQHLPSLTDEPSITRDMAFSGTVGERAGASMFTNFSRSDDNRFEPSSIPYFRSKYFELHRFAIHLIAPSSPAQTRIPLPECTIIDDIPSSAHDLSSIPGTDTLRLYFIPSPSPKRLSFLSS